MCCGGGRDKSASVQPTRSHPPSNPLPASLCLPPLPRRSSVTLLAGVATAMMVPCLFFLIAGPRSRIATFLRVSYFGFRRPLRTTFHTTLSSPYLSSAHKVPSRTTKSPGGIPRCTGEFQNEIAYFCFTSLSLQNRFRQTLPLFGPASFPLLPTPHARPSS